MTLSTAFYATFNKHSACGLKQHKKQVPVTAVAELAWRPLVTACDGNGSVGRGGPIILRIVVKMKVKMRNRNTLPPPPCLLHSLYFIFVPVAIAFTIAVAVAVNVNVNVNVPTISSTIVIVRALEGAAFINVIQHLVEQEAAAPSFIEPTSDVRRHECRRERQLRHPDLSSSRCPSHDLIRQFGISSINIKLGTCHCHV